ncbi:lanthionine synthetase C-like protein [Actinomyces graevenitzii F0530]|jgi:lanthionine synthetase C family protein|uniref:Lanthionine synthetase C-like protein n=1 Tax=Actinomyces graevenitzii F0530 TaxID=1321817 RepID=U1QG17_9ACTO|nr:lanthionine synthetase LanC family protein [Actinomyces graevenitzii]ERH20829.1 lanthionine synthetase C-like protein [Actinomyces graevenitzii F0530]
MKSRAAVQNLATNVAKHLDNIVPVEYEDAQRGNHFNINGGTPGAILYLSVLDALFPDEGYDLRAHTYATTMISEYRLNPNIGIGLFGGTTLLAWCLRAISRDGTRYQGAISDLESRIEFQITQYLTAIAKMDSPIPSEYYDVISGLSGVLLYSSRFRSPKLLSTSQQIGNTFCDILSSWGVKGFGSLSAVSRQVSPGHEDETDYGYAHGLLGVLMSCLVSDSTKNKDVLLTTELDKLIHLSTESNSSLLPYSSGNLQAGLSVGRYAWCYGNVPFYFLSQLLDPVDPTRAQVLADLAVAPLSLAHGADRNDFGMIGLIDNSICHGRAGVLLGLQPSPVSADFDSIQTRLVEDIDYTLDEVNDGGFLEGDLGTIAVRLALECSSSIGRLPAFFPFVSPMLWG